MPQYYSTGEFAKMANVTIRTIRYYDKQGLLSPSYVKETGYRCYTDTDFAKLQKILALKYLGFSLEEIKAITVNDDDSGFIKESLSLQLQLIHKRIEHLQQVERAIQDTSKLFDKDDSIYSNKWSSMINLIHLTNMEKELVEQYRNASNTNIRIDLHKRYSTNPVGWFEWIYSHLDIRDGQKILELGCGNGQLWKDNHSKIPNNIELHLTDISEGMIQDARENIGKANCPITYSAFDCNQIPAENDSYDIVIANHLLFYVKDIDHALQEIQRVLKKGGTFICSTYSSEHMKEIQSLVNEYDIRIALSEVNLYHIFGLDNGEQYLMKHFSGVRKEIYNDTLQVTAPKPLADYILSCHGNQREYLLEDFEKFQEFLAYKVRKKKGLQITKEAGIFICNNLDSW
ncbi:MAG TPA: methyltransferase domain-containing protein [Lachnospiraceae bacterium]|nr:methyltransferase domain-containing protein [Lachnospiraceae bacterium]